MTDKTIKVCGWEVFQRRSNIFRLKRLKRTIFVTIVNGKATQCDKTGNPTPSFINALTGPHEAEISRAILENFDIDSE